jgi:hypothetical protein
MTLTLPLTVGSGVFCAVRAEVLQRGQVKDLVVRQSPASKDVNKEAEEVTALEDVTRRQPVKIQQTEKT